MNTALVPDAPHTDAVLTFAREPYSDNLIAEMRPLWIKHAEEIPQLGLPIDPDLALYKAMHEKGCLRIFTARLPDPRSDGATMLAGYQVFGVMMHPHRRYSREANQQLLYLDPEVRRGWTALRFFRYCWQLLEDEGCRVIHQQFDARHDLSPLFERAGFILTDMTYARRAA